MKKDLKDLWNDYLSGHMALRDRIAMGRMISDPGNKEHIEYLIEEQLGIAPGEADPALELALKKTMEDLLSNLSKASHNDPQAEKTVPFIRSWWAAAVLLGCLISGAYWWSTQKEKAPDIVTVNQPVMPGKQGAILTLADGKEIILDPIKEGVVARQGGALARVVSGGLVYEGQSLEHLYNTISTPKGRQYQLVLPDGTKVWLNAGSSIRFPTSFKDDEKVVSIVGEVYFEVKGSSQNPFRVIVNQQVEIAVLGTHFNVNAYDDEDVIATTLLEGVVRVSQVKNRYAGAAGKDEEKAPNTITLRPGQQALVGTAVGNATAVHAGVTVVKNVDLDMVMAWKNGLFNFEELRLDAAMRQCSRWYNIDVVFPDGVPDIVLSGKMTRGVTLQDLLIVLERLGVKYKLEGNRVIIFK